MDGLAIGDPRGAAAQRNAKVGKDAAGLAGRYTSSSRQQEASRRNHKSAVVLHTGGRCVLPRLPVLAYYTPRAKGVSKQGRRGACRSGQVRSCQARHLGQQQLATAGPFERALSLSLSPIRALCLFGARPPFGVTGFCFLATPPRLSSIYGVPRSMKPGQAESCQGRRLPAVLLLLLLLPGRRASLG